MEVHLVAATMARERYIDLKKLSRRAIDHDVEEGMEAMAEQAGNLAHDRNDRGLRDAPPPPPPRGHGGPVA